MTLLNRNSLRYRVGEVVGFFTGILSVIVFCFLGASSVAYGGAVIGDLYLWAESRSASGARAAHVEIEQATGDASGKEVNVILSLESTKEIQLDYIKPSCTCAVVSPLTELREGKNALSVKITPSLSVGSASVDLLLVAKSSPSDSVALKVHYWRAPEGGVLVSPGKIQLRTREASLVAEFSLTGPSETLEKVSVHLSPELGVNVKEITSLSKVSDMIFTRRFTLGAPSTFDNLPRGTVIAVKKGSETILEIPLLYEKDPVSIPATLVLELDRKENVFIGEVSLANEFRIEPTAGAGFEVKKLETKDGRSRYFQVAAKDGSVFLDNAIAAGRLEGSIG